jgi:hypothetical protein
MLHGTGAGVGIVSDTIRLQRYIKFKKLWIQIQLYKYIFI